MWGGCTEPTKTINAAGFFSAVVGLVYINLHPNCEVPCPKD